MLNVVVVYKNVLAKYFKAVNSNASARVSYHSSLDRHWCFCIFKIKTTLGYKYIIP